MYKLRMTGAKHSNRKKMFWKTVGVASHPGIWQQGPGSGPQWGGLSLLADYVAIQHIQHYLQLHFDHLDVSIDCSTRVHNSHSYYQLHVVTPFQYFCYMS